MRAGVVMLLGLSGCFTARVSVGPHVSTAGEGGVTALAGYGYGWSFDGHQAVYLGATGGVSSDGHARALLVSGVDYVNASTAMPVRLTLRYGTMFGREAYMENDGKLIGFTIAVFPWHGGTHDRGDGHYRSEKGWYDVFPEMEIAMPRGLGIELATDVLLGTSATESPRGERSAMMITVGLVAELDGMMDR